MSALALAALTGALVLVAWLAVVARQQVRIFRRVEVLQAAPAGGASPSAVQRRLDGALRDADLGVGADRVVRVWAGAFGSLTILGLLVGGPVSSVLFGASAAVAPAVVLRMARHRRARRLQRSLPLVLDELAARLRGGSTLPEALVSVGAAPDGSGEAVASLAAAVRAGQPVAQAIDGWQRRTPGGPAELVAAAVGLAAHAGGAAARAVDGVAATLRERLDVEAEAVALAAQARLSAFVIAVAPIGFALLAVATDPRTGRFLFGRPLGWLCLVVGVALDAASAAWMRRIVAGER
jgi:tight adherence protein B